jgi:recombination protein RecT
MTTQSLKAVATGKDQEPKNPIVAFSNFMDKLKPQMALALPKHLTADRMARLAMTAFSSSAQLQNCEPKSIAASIMTAGQLGLEPGINGAGFLVPYGRTCTFVPGWKGLVDLVSRSGRGTVFTGVIFKDQEYTFLDGARRDLIIHNETDLDDPADITHAYAIGWVKDASMPIIELWRVTKITKHRDKYNKVGTKHYSYRDWEMYARKVPLLQVLKYMPCSIEVSNAIAISNAAESGRGATIENGVVIDMDDQPTTQHGASQSNGTVDKSTGEILDTKPTSATDPDDQALKQVEQNKSTGGFQPTAEEIAAIKQREMSEAGQTEQPARGRRERGGMSVE